MRITSVTRETHEGGIELPNFDAVKAALNAFMNGVPGGHETTRLGFSQDAAGGLAVMMAAMLASGNEDRFLTDLCHSLESVVKRGFASRSYDYDGMGTPFFKTTVNVDRVQTGRRQYAYLLHLNAAYVGDKPTAGLATVLGVPRALNSDTVLIEVEPAGTIVKFDFDDVAERLNGIGYGPFNGQQMTDEIMAMISGEDKFRSQTHLTVHHGDTTVTFGIDPYSVKGPYVYNDGTREYVWVQNGPAILAPLDKSYEDGKQFRPALLTAHIGPPVNPAESHWNRDAIVDPALKDAIHHQAAAIAEAFSK